LTHAHESNTARRGRPPSSGEDDSTEGAPEPPLSLSKGPRVWGPGMMANSTRCRHFGAVPDVGNSHLSVTQITRKRTLAASQALNDANFQQKNTLFSSNRTHSTNNRSGFIAPATHLHRPNRPARAVPCSLFPLPCRLAPPAPLTPLIRLAPRQKIPAPLYR
jgi:hypothetical protein